MRKEMIRYRHFLRQTDIIYLGHKCMAAVIMKLEKFPKCLEKIGRLSARNRGHAGPK